MPVKVGSGRCTPPPFDYHMFVNEELLGEMTPEELEQEKNQEPKIDHPHDLLNDVCLSNYDDIWGTRLMPTPPQSPKPFKADLFEMLFSDDCFSCIDDGETLADMNTKIINHDCMWSGHCGEFRCNKSSPLLDNAFINRPTTHTPFNLSTSPINTFNEYSLYDMQEVLHTFNDIEEVHEQQNVERNVFAMANDHSYESSSPLTVKTESEDENTQHESSLIKNPIKILNAGKITKIKCRKINKKPLENSILNSNFSRSFSAKGETSVLKPTIISVSNIKNFQDPSIQAKYKVAINNKKKKINIVNSKNSRQQMIQIKKLSNFNSNIATPFISPSTSDSEESIVSFSSSADDNRKTSPPFRRREHNDSERKRRDHLRNSFDNLRDQVPKLVSAEKRPPRIMILHEATNYVNQLTETGSRLAATQQALEEKKNFLLNILNRAKKCQF